MTRSKATAAVACAALAAIAAVAVFLSAPSRPRPQFTEEKAPAADEGRAAQDVPTASPSVAPAVRREAPLPEEPAQASPVPERETHAKATAAMVARAQQNTKRLYAGFFEKKGLSPDVRNQIATILSQPIQALADESLAAMRAGVRTTPPSPETLRNQRTQQDAELRSLLGEEGFAEFASYRQSIPDRIIIDGMQRQGAELSEEQSQQLLAILSEERRKISGPPGAPRNLESLPGGGDISVLQQEQEKLREAVSARTGSVLNPGQAAALGEVFSRLNRPPKPR